MELVPEGLVTATLTVPAACAGVVTVSALDERAVTVAALPPKVALLTLSRLVPLMMTEVPPVAAPWLGARVLMVGIDGGT